MSIIIEVSSALSVDHGLGNLRSCVEDLPAAINQALAGKNENLSNLLKRTGGWLKNCVLGTSNDERGQWAIALIQPLLENLPALSLSAPNLFYDVASHVTGVLNEWLPNGKQLDVLPFPSPKLFHNIMGSAAGPDGFLHNFQFFAYDGSGTAIPLDFIFFGSASRLITTRGKTALDGREPLMVNAYGQSFESPQKLAEYTSNNIDIKEEIQLNAFIRNEAEKKLPSCSLRNAVMDIFAGRVSEQYGLYFGTGEPVRFDECNVRQLSFKEPACLLT